MTDTSTAGTGNVTPTDFIHRFLPARQPDAPLLVVLHGHGGSEGALVDLATFLAPAAHVLSPRGQARTSSTTPSSSSRSCRSSPTPAPTCGATRY